MTTLLALGFWLAAALIIGGIALEIVGDMTDDEFHKGIGRGFLIASFVLLPVIVTANGLAGVA